MVGGAHSGSVRPGTVLAGRFEVRAPLGAGGMGEVYEAFDREKQFLVALKTMRTLKPEALLQFKNEFRAMESIRHPNLVGLGELFEAEGRLFFTMDLVRGVPLMSWLRRGHTAPPQHTPTPLSDPYAATMDLESPGAPPAPTARFAEAGCDEARLRACLRQLVDALCAIHAAGKVHRDVKPANVLVTAEGRLVLLDFGLVADAALPAAHSSHVLGTAQYIAPEQLSGTVGPAADWYAVGVILYEALTGTYPFDASGLAVLELKRRVLPVEPEARVAGLPPELSALCMRLLQPDPALRGDGGDVLAALGDGPVAASRALRTLFVGRAGELAALQRALADSRDRPVTVLAEGVSGVGKSALLTEFTHRLTAADARAVVLAGRCYEREAVPFKAVDGLIDALAVHLSSLDAAARGALVPDDVELLARTFPVLAPLALGREPSHPLEPQERRRRLFAGVRDALDRLARTAPLVLVIDDYHRTDPDSVALLREVLRGPGGPPLLLLCSIRPDPPSAIAALPGDVRRLVVGGLTPELARAFVQALDPRLAADGDGLRAIAEESAGHPLFIRELVRHARAGRTDARGVDLDETLWARVAGLDPEARATLELVTVAGTPTSTEALAGAVGGEREVFERALAELRASQLVLSHALGVEPYHDRIAVAVRAHLSSERRVDCHRRLALSLERLARPADLETLAVHFAEAGVSAKASEYAGRAAAQAVQALAFDRASRLYRLALEHAPAEPARRSPLLAALGDALANAGRGREAAEAYDGALAGAPPEQALALQHKAAEQLLVSGHVAQGIAALHRVLPGLGMRMPATARGSLAALVANRLRLRVTGLGFRERAPADVPPLELLKIDAAWSVAAKLSTSDVMRSAYFQSVHLLMALRAGEPFRICRALMAEAIYSAVGGPRNSARSAQLLETTAALARRLKDPYATACVEGARGWVAFLEDRPADAAAAFDQCVALLTEGRCTNVAWELATGRSFALFSTILLGRLEAAAARIERLAPEAEDRGDLHLETHLKAGLPTHCWLALDRPDEARRVAREVVGRWSTTSYQFPHAYLLWTESFVDLYNGDGDAADRRQEEQWPAVTRAYLTINQAFFVTTMALRGRCAAAAGRLDRLAWCVAKLRRFPSAVAATYAASLYATLAEARGEHDEARRALADAQAGFTRTGMVLNAARAQHELGRLTGGPAGETLAADAERSLRGAGIARPDRFVRILS